MKQMLPIRFPLKGYTENTAYGQLPPGFTHDCLNVRPFDKSGRLRGGQRPGTNKFVDDPVEADQTIQKLIQGTLATLPTEPGSQVQYSDDFTYTDGPLTTRTGTQWSATYRFGSGPSTPAADTSIEALSNKAVESTTNSGRSNIAVHNSFATPDGEQFFMRAKFVLYLPGVSGSEFATKVGLFWGGDIQDGVSADFGIAFLDLNSAGQLKVNLGTVSQPSGDNGHPTVAHTATVATGIVADAGPYTLEVQRKISGGSETFTVLVDGVEYLTDKTMAVVGCSGGVCSNHSAGIYMANNTSLQSTTIDDFEAGIIDGEGTVDDREHYLVAVCNGSIYQSDASPVTTMSLATSGSGAVGKWLRMGATEGPASPNDSASFNTHRFIYFCDPNNYTRLDLNDATVRTWAAASGSLPTDSDGKKCNIICLYRGRIVMAGLPGDPANWFMSAVGDPTDWDYSPATPSATQAVAGNNSDAGRVGDAITALIPFSDDILIIGCDHSVWQMTGDPADGGRLDVISHQTGIVGPEAWTRSPDGTLYFVGTNGVYRLPVGSTTPELVSQGKLDTAFAGYNYRQARTMLFWDRDRQGMHIFRVENVAPDTAPTQYWYDARTDSFWLEQYPINAGPTAGVVFDADAPGDRTFVFGGFDGYLRKFANGAANDDNGATNSAIDSYVEIGPISLGQTMMRCGLQDLQVILAKDLNGADLSIYAANSPEQAMAETTPKVVRTLNAGRNVSIRQRVANNSLRLRLRNNTAGQTWAFEEGAAVFRVGGRMRGDRN